MLNADIQSSQRNTLHPCAHELHMGCTTDELALSPGGTLFFSSYVGSGPASTVHPKNIRYFKHPIKIFEILVTPQNIPPFCTLTLRKDPKMYKNNP